ncbi:MAG: tetratricopeptide repeat protein [Candidatus Promineifilaceae bacterium]
MMKNKQRLPYLLSLLIGLILLVTACGPSKAERLNNEGNEAFTQQAFQDALVAYQSAQIDEPELAEPYYNAANALYRQGAYDAALEQMQLALSYANADSLAQAGYYNLGNTSYSQQDLQAAIDAYTQALLLNPNDQDAKYNLELALQQQQQQQNEEEQQQEQQDQQDQQDQSEDGQSEEEQQQDQNADQQEGEGQDEQQQQQEGQDEQQQQQDQQGQESDQGEQSQESQEQQQEGQEGDQQSEDQAQDQAGQGQPQDGQPQEEQPGQLNQMPQPGQRMTAEQAEQLLAAIARDGQTLQEKLGQIFAVPWAPPVQDW